MTHRLTAVAALLLLALAAPAMAETPKARGDGTIVLAQGQTDDGAAPARKSRKRGAAKKELTVGQMGAAERRKKCSAEWKEAKAAGKTGGLKWPKFYSQCNARLKGTTA